MRVPLYVVDAFTETLFGGNPAAVVLFDAYPKDRLLQQIAAENNLAETAYPVRLDDGTWELRWFTPTVEVPLCGHATLASAYVVFNYIAPEASEIRFATRRSGELVVKRQGKMLTMDFPGKPAERSQDNLSFLFGNKAIEVWKSEAFTMVVLESPEAVQSFEPVREKIMSLDRDGLIVTARGDGDYDCVSRFFTPAHGIDEDPVTGGAHTMLAPFWAQRLGKSELRAWQASQRGGEILCRVEGDRVHMAGHCVPYLTGSIEV